MRVIASALFFIFTSIALVAPAFADDPPTKPAFALMDNTGDGSKVNLDIAAIVPTDGDANGTLFRSSLIGQYVAPNGFGGYAGISASKLMFDDSGVNHAGIGNLELGGLYQHALDSNFDLSGRIGLILPTAADKDELHLVNTLLARPGDLATALPGTTWLRLGLSPTFHSGSFFLRTDLGVDVPFIDAHGTDPIGHFNLGAGIGHDGFTATAEMQTVFLLSNNRSDNSFHTAGVSVRYQGTRVSPFVSVSTPLEDEFRGKVATVTAGLTFSF